MSASIGVAVGPARMLGRERRGQLVQIAEADVPAELERFAEAVSKSRAEIEAAKQELTQQHGPTYAPILDVYLLMHGDALLIDAVDTAIRDERVNAEWAVEQVTARLKQPLLADSSSYFQERANDIDHVKEHLLRHLCGGEQRERPVDGPSVLLARDLTPADAVRLLRPPTVGLVTELGAGSSHTAILARAFGVPAVVGVGQIPEDIEDGELVLVDGFSGNVTVRASEEARLVAEERRRRFTAFLEAERSAAAVTRDGVSISVSANVELPNEIEVALDNGA
ncbi:MAG: phosphoenolpyruvate-utilizing N-terminal domain-containing protein, partial [Polyangiales bacterium]